MWHDVRYAIRSLRRSPGFTVAATLTLAFGIGATTAIYSLVDAVILRSLPVRNPEELVLVGGSQYPVFQAFRQRTDIFVNLLATSGVTPLDVEVQSGVRERTSVSLVSGSYFATLGVQPSMGRLFAAGDDVHAGANPIAVASHGYWQRRLGGDAGVIDRVVRVSGVPVTIVGVAPAGFFGENVGVAPDLWMPLTMWEAVVPGRNLLQSPGTGWLRLIGRVHPGSSTSGVHLVLTETFRQVLTGIFGPNMGDDQRRDIASATIRLTPAANGISAFRTRFARPLQLLLGAVVLVLLIACANIANLLLARAASRRREIDVRLALGVSRRRLIRQLLTESLVLAGIGGTLGIGIASFAREALLRMMSTDGSRVPLALAGGGRLLATVALLSTATAILFGLAPAWQSSRPQLASSLAARRDVGGHRSRKLTALLVIAQVAVSLVLVMGAGLFLRTLANLGDVDLGFASERLLVADVNPQAAGYRGDAAIEINRRLLARIAALPNVASASFAENGVLSGRESTTNLMHPVGFVAGPDGFPRARWDIVGPRYFSTIGTTLVAGRDFTDADTAGSPPVVAIDEEMARVFFRGENPIGRSLVWGAETGTRIEVVAVVRNVKSTGPRPDPLPHFYLPHYQLPVVRPNWIPASTLFVVRTTASPTALAPLMRGVVTSEDERLSIARIDLGPELVGRTLVQERMVAILLVAFGVLALGLACLGLYGLIAYDVAQRTSEIGIRMALGAQRSDVLRIVMRRAILWIAAGVAVGVPLVVASAGIARSLLFGLTPTDPMTFAGAAMVIAVMGVLAAYIPARRATRVDPLVALRAD